MRLARIGAVAVGTGVLALALSGCVAFKGDPKLRQIGHQPKVALQFRACVSGPECAESGASGDFRLLIGVRKQTGAKLPATLTAKDVDFGSGSGTDGPVVLSRDASYTAELNAKAPGRAGRTRWTGYSSEPVAHPEEAGTDSEGRFRVLIEVPDRLVGRRLKVRPVLGIWQVSDAQPEGTPVDCGPDPFDETGSVDSADLGICIDAPERKDWRILKLRVRR